MPDLTPFIFQAQGRGFTLPQLDGTTVFLALLSLCAIAAIWGIYQLISVMGGGDENPIERRLGEADFSRAAATDAALVRAQDQPAWLEASEAMRRFATRLDLVSPGRTVAQFFLICIALSLLLGATGTLLLSFFPYGIAGFVLGALLPYLHFKMAYNKRRRILADQLIEALDFLSRVLRAGHSLASGLQMVGDELPEPIAPEFRRCYEQHNLGKPLDDALVDTARRIDLEDFAFFVTSVSIQRQTGGDLAEILDNINGMIRARIRLSQHVKALTAEGRATGYVLTALPVLIFLLMLLFNPDYGGELIRRSEGRMMLFGAVTLQVFGLIVIRRIVDIRV
jgi:tight adherence protein B